MRQFCISELEPRDKITNDWKQKQLCQTVSGVPRGQREKAKSVVERLTDVIPSSKHRSQKQKTTSEQNELPDGRKKDHFHSIGRFSSTDLRTQSALTWAGHFETHLVVLVPDLWLA